MTTLKQDRPSTEPPIIGRWYVIHHVIHGDILTLYPMSHGEACTFKRAQMKPSDWVLVDVTPDQVKCMLTTIEQRYYDELIKPSVCFDNYNIQQFPTLKSIIKAEKHGYTVRLIEDWLRGLPSACTIPFYDDAIIAMGYDLNFYWNTTARVLYKVAGDIKHP